MEHCPNHKNDQRPPFLAKLSGGSLFTNDNIILSALPIGFIKLRSERVTLAA